MILKALPSYSVVLKARPRKSEVALCLRDMLMSFWKYKIWAEWRRGNSLTNHTGKLTTEWRMEGQHKEEERRQKELGNWTRSCSSQQIRPSVGVAEKI